MRASESNLLNTRQQLTNQDVSNALRETFLASCSDEAKNSIVSFDANKFFTAWFRKNGSPYFFLFKKNLSTTNIQFAELVSLAKLHTVNLSTKTNKFDLHFFTVRDFINGIQQVVSDLASSGISKSKLCDSFMGLYEEILENTVLLEVFRGSCSLFYPNHIELDLFKVCSESGYIHSCGQSVYIRNLAESDDHDFINKISSYVKDDLKNETSSDSKRFLVAFCHEDFTKYDRDDASSLKNGLDDVKIYVEKYSIGKRPLVKVLRELQELNKGQLYVAGAGDFRLHPQIINDGRLVKGKTMWLIIDRALNTQGSPTDEQFLICYDQFFINENPLHIFDENKPAWVAHTTVPHTLVAAMLNITRPLWPKVQTVNIYDPFCGTGTTAFEAIKFSSVSMTYNDLSSIGDIMLKDNLEFFALNKEDLEHTKKILTELSNRNSSEYNPVSGKLEAPNDFQAMLDLLVKVKKTKADTEQSDDEWFDIPNEIVHEFQKLSRDQKLRFYIALRTEIRHVNARENRWTDAYVNEAKMLTKQTVDFLELRKRQDANHSKFGEFDCIEATYSKACTINPKVFAAENWTKKLKIFKQDARNLPDEQMREAIDLVITDPPYGFNNDMKAEKLADILTKTLDAIFSALKGKSQLVISLPEHSHSGKKIPLFATKMWITEQILGKAEKAGFEVVNTAEILPRIGNLFHPPYYWNSEKALKRTILHFFLRKKATHERVAAD
jgi:16S rRNA G966 N2-methylase RsmD